MTRKKWYKNIIFTKEKKKKMTYFVIYNSNITLLKPYSKVT